MYECVTYMYVKGGVNGVNEDTSKTNLDKQLLDNFIDELRFTTTGPYTKYISIFCLILKTKY